MPPLNDNPILYRLTLLPLMGVPEKSAMNRTPRAPMEPLD